MFDNLHHLVVAINAHALQFNSVLHLQLNCCGGSTSETSNALCEDIPDDAPVNSYACYNTLYTQSGAIALS